MSKKLIDKDALVAEIERRIKVSQDYAKCNLTESTKIGNQSQLLELNDILSFLDTFEVKEVDLEKEATKIVQSKEFIEGKESPILLIAKHFFELGSKLQKEE